MISGCWGRSPEGQTQASSVLRTTPLASGWGPWSKGALDRCSAHVNYIGLSCLQCAAHVHTSNCFPCSYLDKALSDGRVHLSLSNAVKGIFFFLPYFFNRVLESLLRKSEHLQSVSHLWVSAEVSTLQVYLKCSQEGLGPVYRLLLVQQPIYQELSAYYMIYTGG